MKLHYLLGMQQQLKTQKKKCYVDLAIVLTLYLVVFDIIGSKCDGCFITDCPSTILKKGFAKKDSTKENVLESPQQSTNYRSPRTFHQCALCGPSLTNPRSSYDASATFRCFGPDLCCSTDFGCLPQGSSASSMCILEDLTSIKPCKNKVPSCNSVPQGGQCVTNGLCCNSKGHCKEDASCQATSTAEQEKQQHNMLDNQAPFSQELIGSLSEIPTAYQRAPPAFHTKKEINDGVRRRSTYHPVVVSSYPQHYDRPHQPMTKALPPPAAFAHTVGREIRRSNVQKDKTQQLLEQFRELSEHYRKLRRMISKQKNDIYNNVEDDQDFVATKRTGYSSRIRKKFLPSRNWHVADDYPLDEFDTPPDYPLSQKETNKNNIKQYLRFIQEAPPDYSLSPQERTGNRLNPLMPHPWMV